MRKPKRKSGVELRPVTEVKELSRTDLLAVAGGGKGKKKKMELIFLPAFAARP